MQLAGATVLLTGASGGIGAAIARRLDARGARVLLNGRRVEALEELRAELGPHAHVLAADLADTEDAARLVEQAGRVDVLVANAALPASGALHEYTSEQIDRALDVNLRAPIQLTRALLPDMLERRRGHLVYVNSLSGKAASVRSVIYSTTKFGLRGFASGLRQDLHGTGVFVTTIYPGFVSGAGMFAEAEVELPRFVATRTPEDVAAAVVKGIEEERAEVDVAPLSLRLGAAVASVAPVTMARLQRRLGAERVGRELAHGQRHKR